MTQRRATIHVLHVDDQPTFGEMVATYLERAEGESSLTVSTVTDARTALARLDESRVDCVVSDYEMPGMDGLELLQAVRGRYPNLPFVLFTGRGGEEVARDAFQVGVTDYMQKRTGTDQYAVLAKRIRNAVSQHRAQAASERYGTAIEALDTALYVLDGAGRFTLVDDRFVDLTGYSREEILGRHLSALDTDGSLTERFETLVAPDEEFDGRPFDADVEPSTGHPRRFRCHLTVHQLTDDGVGSVVGTLQDTTDPDQRRDLQYYDGLTDLILDTSTTLMSAEADEVDTKLHWALENLANYVGADRCTVYSTVAPDGTADPRQDPPAADDVRKAYEWCDAGVEPGDWPVPTDPASEWWLDILHRFENVQFDDLASMPPQAATLRDRFERQGVESLVAVPLVSDWSMQGFVEFVSHDAATQWSEREVRLLRTLGDLVAQTLDRRRREDELARYKTLVETVPDGVFLLDEVAQMTQVNEAFASSLGYEVDEILGEPFSTLIDAGVVDPSIVQEYLDGVQAMRAGEREKNVFEVEVDPATPGSDTRVYEAHTRLLPYDDGFQGTAGIARDVTEEHRQKAQLRRQNERLDKFASVVTHDLRNPLNIAQGFLDVARETGDESHLDRVDNALTRIDSLVDNVLSLARRGQTVGQTTDVDVATTALLAWDAVETHEATLEVSDDLTPIVADEDRFREVIENLFRNAVEHGSTDVTVSVDGLADRPGFAVADDGPGIPPARREHVFDHGHSTTEDGTGFGLAIVRDIVEAHGWHIELTEADGGGARFEVVTGQGTADQSAHGHPPSTDSLP